MKRCWNARRTRNIPSSFLRLDATRGVLRLLPKNCGYRTCDAPASACPPSHGRRTCSARRGLDLQHRHSPTHPWYALRASQSYERAHRSIQSAFARLNVSTELAPACRKEIPGQCFTGFEKSDVLWLGKKNCRCRTTSRENRFVDSRLHSTAATDGHSRLVAGRDANGG